ncbi:MAG: chemotaxis-specific protein-glutamate methyltransferase CheB [Candidatus Neomarinimicrobiota bacterium]
MIKILIADDSAVTREFLTYLFNSTPDFLVAGTAKNGKEAVQIAYEKHPDIIIMDVNMPIMDGFEATRQIMETQAVPIVIVSASYDPSEVETSFRALEAGALMILEKPPGIGHPGHKKAVDDLLRLTRLMSEVKVITRRTKKPESKIFNLKQDRQPLNIIHNGFELVAIGTSTGGPIVLQKILSKLPAQFPVPIIIVQHISKGFLEGMAEWLNQISPLTVRIPQNLEVLLPGHAYLAPDGFQIGVAKNDRISVRLTQGQSKPAFCPSVAEMFRSVTDVLAPNVIGVLLTGMGNDGAHELKRMRGRGGITIAQNEESCVVFGMPKVAIELGAAKYILNPDEIAALLNNLVQT